MRLAYGAYYHLYNRGINKTNLFLDDADYLDFLKRYAYYMEPVADTFAYVLMPNHFHFLLGIKPPDEQWAFRAAHVNEKHPPHKLLNPSTQFGHCCNGYTKHINAKYKRTGSLFEKTFKAKQVVEASYFGSLICYIHQNPIKHGFTIQPDDWIYSSYHAYVQTDFKSRIKTHEGVQYFGSLSSFIQAHAVLVESSFFE